MYFGRFAYTVYTVIYFYQSNRLYLAILQYKYLNIPGEIFDVFVMQNFRNKLISDK